MEELLEQLKDIKKGVDWEHETALFDGGHLDSYDVIQIISLLDDEYDISVPPSQIIPANFNSVQAIYDMIQRLSDD